MLPERRAFFVGGHSSFYLLVKHTFIQAYNDTYRHNSREQTVSTQNRRSDGAPVFSLFVLFGSKSVKERDYLTAGAYTVR